jgi:ferritin-like metal-binding protein YciE
MSQPYSFHELFIEQINDLYSAEEQVSPVLPRIIAVTSSGSLREEFDIYFQELEQHIEHLKVIFQEISSAPKGSVCKAVEGMLEEVEQVIHHGGNSAVKDAALIAILQRIIHYKIAVYGTARTFARHLNYNKNMDLLQRALNEEGEADKKLTRLAEGGMFTTGINEEATKPTVHAYNTNT